MRNSVVSITLYVQGALVNTQPFIMQNRVLIYVHTIQILLNFVFMVINLYTKMHSKGRCKIQIARRVHHDEFLGPVESCSESWLHTSRSYCHLKELSATLSIYAVIYM